MSDAKKFEAFKESIVRENENKYGKEVREKYGDEEADAANRKLMNMSEADHKRFKELEEEIKACLKEGVASQIKLDSEYAKRVVSLHKEWLCMTWKQYTGQKRTSRLRRCISVMRDSRHTMMRRLPAVRIGWSREYASGRTGYRRFLNGF